MLLRLLLLLLMLLLTLTTRVTTPATKLIKLKAFEPPKLRNFFASNDGNKEFKDVLHRIPDRF